jgi:hypothetical protein
MLITVMRAAAIASRARHRVRSIVAAFKYLMPLLDLVFIELLRVFRYCGIRLSSRGPSAFAAGGEEGVHAAESRMIL